MTDEKIKIINNDIKNIVYELVNNPAHLDGKSILKKIYDSNCFYTRMIDKHIFKNQEWVYIEKEASHVKS